MSPRKFYQQVPRVVSSAVYYSTQCPLRARSGPWYFKSERLLWVDSSSWNPDIECPLSSSTKHPVRILWTGNYSRTPVLPTSNAFDLNLHKVPTENHRSSWSLAKSYVGGIELKCLWFEYRLIFINLWRVCFYQRVLRRANSRKWFGVWTICVIERVRWTRSN